MRSKYKFKYKKGWFWNSVTVVGHRYEKDQDKMIMFLEDGGIIEVAQWRLCCVKLGSDWYEAQKKYMEQEAGQQIQTNVGNG